MSKPRPRLVWVSFNSLPSIPDLTFLNNTDSMCASYRNLSAIFTKTCLNSSSNFFFAFPRVLPPPHLWCQPSPSACCWHRYASRPPPTCTPWSMMALRRSSFNLRCFFSFFCWGWMAHGSSH